MASKKGKTKELRHSVNFWQALRDVLIASLAKGQFIPACIFFVLITLILKMPEGEVPKFLLEVKNDLKEGSLIGYALALILAIGWFIHAKYLRRKSEQEIRRITEERNTYQRDRNGKDFTESSEKP